MSGKLNGRNRTLHAAVLQASGMGMALLVDVLIARKLGGGGAADPIILALLLPRWIAVASRDAIKMAFVSVLIEARGANSNSERVSGASLPGSSPEGVLLDQRLAGGLFTALLMGGLALGILMLVLAEPLARLVAPEQHVPLTASLLTWVCPIAMFGMAACVPEAWLNSVKMHRQSMARSIIVSVPPLLVLWLADDDPDSTSLSVLAIGFATGWVLVAVYLTWCARRAGFVAGWTWLTASEWRSIGRALGPTSLGFGLRQGARAVLMVMAGVASPAGGITAFYLAQRLIGAMQNIVGVTLGMTGQHKFTKLDLATDRDGFIRAVKGRAKLSLMVSVPMTIVVVLCSEWIVAELFDFDAQTEGRAAGVLAALSLSLPTAGLIPVLMSAIYAQRRYTAALSNMVLAAAVMLISSWALLQPWGLTGVAVGVLIGSWVSIANLLRLLLQPIKREQPV